MTRRARALMVQGTGSDVGKSLLTAGLCRVFTRRGLEVLPFKAQNMSNNAAVTAGGGEIGRAQWLQALACGAQACVEMNPVLLKPESERGCQVVVRGKVRGRSEASEYQHLKQNLLPEVLASFEYLRARADLVLAEGAGSPAEVNLRAGDIANMGFARAAGVPVVLAGDIGRGGLIAGMVGTHAVLDAGDRAMIKGFITNRFRGDPALFAEGRRIISERTGWRDFGLVMHLPQAAHLPREDGYSYEEQEAATRLRAGGEKIRILVPLLPRISNLDDFDPLRAEADVELVFIRPGEALPVADLVILPGSKSTRADLAFLRAEGWDVDLLAHARRGGRILGICGGFQMLGEALHDPGGHDGKAGSAVGLGLLPVSTRFGPDKALHEWAGRCAVSGLKVAGYHMHTGVTTANAALRPFLFHESGAAEGAVSENGRIAGCYVHGLFATDGFRHAFLNRLHPRTDSGLRYASRVESALDSVADALEESLDIEGLLATAA